ncbi:histidine phosphatase family protein [Nocardioides sp. CN2-186]|uniref:SixA phosphatase family protein n=1 Tax=Nocardioides tweenelious TaxID=3156607 RepID=UPI0032B3541C
MRRLVVMRHAKAEQDGPTDFDRPLAARGHRDAEEAGRWLAGIGPAPDHALVSAALRTRETWAYVEAGADWDLDPELDRGLYAAGPDTALDLIRLTGDDVTSLVVVGHNPTMGSLAQLLDDGDASPEHAEGLVSGFPTSAVAVFDHDGSWADLGWGSASLVDFHVGRG